MISSKEYKGKTLETILETIEKDLQVNIDEVSYTVTTENSLFSKSISVNVYDKSEIVEYIKNILSDMLERMLITNPNIEILSRERNTIFNIISSNNAVLIGKDGRNIDSIQHYLRSVLYSQLGINFNFLIDVEGYKQKKQNRLVKLAHQLADEAVKTKEQVILRNLNSYERRLVHQELTKSDLIKTHSEGQGSNRYLVITPKEKV